MSVNIEYAISPEAVIRALRQMNEAQEAWEKGGVAANEQVSRAFERTSDLLVRANDKHMKSVDRIIMSVQRQAEAYGMPQWQRIIQQRDELIKKFAGEEDVIRRLTAAYDPLIQKARQAAQVMESGGGGGSSFNFRYAFFGVKDLAEGRTKFALAEIANELVSIGGKALVIGGVTAAVVGIGVAAFETRERLERLAEAPKLVHNEFARVADQARLANDELRLTNDRLENAIAKLSHKPENGLKVAIDEAAVAADHLAAKMDSALSSFAKLAKESAPGMLDTLTGRAAGQKDILELIQGKTGFGGLKGDLYDITRAGGNPTAVLDTYRGRVQQLLNYSLYSQGMQQDRFNPNRADLRDLARVYGGSYSTADQSTRIEVLRALVSQINDLAQGYQLEQRNAGLNAVKDRLENRTEAEKKLDELRRTGQSGYVIGTGTDATVVSGTQYLQDIEKARVRRAPSLFGPRELSPEVQAQVGQFSNIGNATLPGGMQVVNGELVFVSPGSQRQVQGGQDAFSEARLKAVGAGYDQQRRQQDAQRLQALQIEAQYTEKIIDLRKGPGGELAAARQIAGIRQKALDEEYRVTGDIAKYREGSLRNELELQTQMAELQKRQHDEIAKTSEGLYHTLFTNPGGFGRQLSTTMRNAAFHPIEQRLGNLTANFLQPIIGTAGGDPIKVSTDLNTQATMANTAALYAHANAIAGGVGPGIGTSLYSAGGPSFSAGGGTVDYTGGLGAMSFPGAGNVLFGGGAAASGGGGILGGLSRILGGPGGTSGFAGQIGQGGVASIPGWASGGFKNIFSGATFGHAGLMGNLAGYGGTYSGTANGGGQVAALSTGPFQGTALGSLAAGGGLALAEHGLLGDARGSLSGVAQGALGGFLVAGPIGAAVGAAIGFGEMIAGVEPEWKKIIRVVRQQYGVGINKQTANQIIAIAKQSYGGNDEVAVRSPEVRQMLGLYAAGTGQAGKFAGMSSLTPHGASFVESGGALFQQATYQYGNQFVQSSSLPTYGGGSPGVYPGGAPLQIALNIGSASAGKFMDGEYVTPENVSNRFSAALESSMGRLNTAMTFAQPGAIVS